MKVSLASSAVAVFLVALHPAAAKLGGRAPAKLRGGPSLARSVSVPVKADNTRGIDFPSFRYVPWCMLDEKAQEQADDIQWDQDTWNVPGTGSNEQNSFLVVQSQSDAANISLTGMGWTEEVFDCYVNHYVGYDWDELQEFTDTVPFWEGLGWNESSWNGETAYPETESMDWSELNASQQAAAIALCYFEELWMEMNITQWDEFVNATICKDDGTTVATTTTTPPTTIPPTTGTTIPPTTGTTTPPANTGTNPSTSSGGILITAPPGGYPRTPSPTASPTAAQTLTDTILETNIQSVLQTGAQTTGAPDEDGDDEDTTTIEVVYVSNPMNRFLLWSWLFEKSRAAATTLGYDEATWNQPFSAPVESLVFDDLDTNQVEATYVLGLAPADVWDCHINHYRGYNWDELDKAGVRTHYEVLGWTFESWSLLQQPPATDGTPFSSLTADQQAAAKELCYREQTWDKLNLMDWVI